GVGGEEGAPVGGKSGGGRAFRSGRGRGLRAGLGSWVLYSPAYRPEYNGSVEAGNKSLKRRTEAIAAAAGRPGEWREEDLEAARREANAHGRPRGSKVAPAVAGECRERVPEAEGVAVRVAGCRQARSARQPGEGRSER